MTRLPSFSRREWLKGLVGITLLPLSGCRLPGGRHSHEGGYFWSGIGFGIEMSMELQGVSREAGERLGAHCERVIGSLEEAFSLYLEDSELSVLNRERVLKKPSGLFLDLLRLAVKLEQRTMGYYQPAVHGAWEWLRQQRDPLTLESNDAWLRHAEAMDLKYLEVDPKRIRLLHPLTALSMNAIGQGFLADQVAREVQAAGVTSAMLHLGETVAIGRHPSGRPWRLAVAGSAGKDQDAEIATVELIDAGLAVSSTDQGRRLIDPVAGQVRARNRTVAVVTSEGAAVADAFATAFAVAPETSWQDLFKSLNSGGVCQVHIWEDGRVRLRKMG